MDLLVQAGQIHVNNWLGLGIETDGIYGPDTKAAGIKAVQHACNIDYDAGLEEDGMWGINSSAALSGHYVCSGESQALVTATQILLYMRGYNPNGADGIFGDGTYSAVVMFQRANGLDPDGVAGVQTISALMNAPMVARIEEESYSEASGEWSQYDPNNLPNFSNTEFMCQCGCGTGDCVDELKCKAQMLRDKLCEHYGQDMPMTITDGYRCPSYNAAEGGTSDSLHKEGKAFDFQCYYDGTYHMSADMIDTIRELAHECGMTTGNYYETGFVHCQLGRNDFWGD